MIWAGFGVGARWSDFLSNYLHQVGSCCWWNSSLFYFAFSSSLSLASTGENPTVLLGDAKLIAIRSAFLFSVTQLETNTKIKREKNQRQQVSESCRLVGDYLPVAAYNREGTKSSKKTSAKGAQGRKGLRIVESWRKQTVRELFMRRAPLRPRGVLISLPFKDKEDNNTSLLSFALLLSFSLKMWLGFLWLYTTTTQPDSC